MPKTTKATKAAKPSAGALKTLEVAGLIKDMTPAEARALAKIAVEHRYPKGAAIVREDAKSRDLFVIKQGRVSIQVVLPAEYGRDEMVYAMRDGQVFGELSLLDGSPRSATVKADDDVIAYRFDYHELNRMLEEQPRMGFEAVNWTSQRPGNVYSEMERVKREWGRAIMFWRGGEARLAGIVQNPEFRCRIAETTVIVKPDASVVLPCSAFPEFKSSSEESLIDFWKGPHGVFARLNCGKISFCAGKNHHGTAHEYPGDYRHQI
jgi:hypothetical protein